MQKLTKAFLVISGILFIFFNSGCNTRFLEGYVPVTSEKESDFNVPYFANPGVDYVYKANITVYGHELTGIFVTKKINDSTHRVVYTTEFGNKLLDCEISAHNFKVNSIVDELNKKTVVNTLKTDFRLLLTTRYLAQKLYKNDSGNVYRASDGRRYNYLFAAKSQQLQKIIHGTKRKEKIAVVFTSATSATADKVVITHKNIKLRIELNNFTRE